MIDVIAIFTMLLDHVGLIFFPDVLVLRIIGRFAFPLFAWGVARGYKYTKDFKKYAIRLSLFAIVSQFPYYFLLENKYLNIGFTLLAGLIILRIYNSLLNRFLKCLIISSIIILSQVLHFEYGIYGILTIFIFYRYWGKERIIYYQFVLTLISTFVLRFDPIQLTAAFSPILILSMDLVQKKDIRLSKVFRYGFYPTHLLILFLIKNGGV